VSEGATIGKEAPWWARVRLDIDVDVIEVLRATRIATCGGEPNQTPRFMIALANATPPPVESAEVVGGDHVAEGHTARQVVRGLCGWLGCVHVMRGY
jgi:hypothetical protein